MGQTPAAAVDVRALLVDEILQPSFRRATFAGPARGAARPWTRVTLRPLAVRGRPHVQFAYFDQKRCVTKNHPLPDAPARVDELLALGFPAIHLSTDREEVDVRLTLKGKALVGRRAAAPVDAAAPAPVGHNRVKDVPLPEGKPDHLLQVLGVQAPDGSIRPTMRAKFTQINEFLKHLGHALAGAGLEGLGRPIEILDCGSGSAYLTLAAHHYLNQTLGLPANITGVDVNDAVVRKSMTKAADVGAEVNFQCSPISGAGGPADVVIALHACDTATDDALARAVRAGAAVILCVPCCHHALHASIRAEGPAAPLRPILRHGLLQQRAADLATDAFRALVLRIMGYRTDVVEFVSPEHTARNLMIRAVKAVPAGERAFVDEYRDFRRFWGAAPALASALSDLLSPHLSEEVPPCPEPGSP